MVHHTAMEAEGEVDGHELHHKIQHNDVEGLNNIRASVFTTQLQ